MSFPSDIRGIYQSEKDVVDANTGTSEKVVVVANVQREVVLFRGPSSDPEVTLTTDQMYSNRVLGSDATVTISSSKNFGTGAAQQTSLNFKPGGTVKMDDGTEEPHFSFKTPLLAFGTGAFSRRRADRKGLVVPSGTHLPLRNRSGHPPQSVRSDNQVLVTPTPTPTTRVPPTHNSS